MASIDVAPVRSKDRVEKGSYSAHVASFPVCPTTLPAAPADIAAAWVRQLDSAVSSRNFKSLEQLFMPHSYWRDQLCLSWDFHTLHGQKKIIEFLESGSMETSIKSFTIDTSKPHRVPTITTIDFPGQLKCIQLWLSVDTTVGKAQGIAKLVCDTDSRWKAFTLLTTLREIVGHEEAIGTRRSAGVNHGGVLGRSNWQDRRHIETSFESTDPTVLIIGNCHKPADRFILVNYNC